MGRGRDSGVDEAVNALQFYGILVNLSPLIIVGP